MPFCATRTNVVLCAPNAIPASTNNVAHTHEASQLRGATLLSEEGTLSKRTSLARPGLATNQPMLEFSNDYILPTHCQPWRQLPCNHIHHTHQHLDRMRWALSKMLTSTISKTNLGMMCKLTSERTILMLISITSYTFTEYHTFKQELCAA